ncbi:hypothetical protein [Kineosporia succinea]|uniref:N-acetyltransferase domain-containing protein n=1 Tax=Kineosporia succinea TaxID=84632 RepID=A0ABT9PE14_9ACTN|nr:hypothetical protein [Kineosporia succinea]MDP9830951.1 hypothetical protein [Kineosporia succinea]
MNRPAPVPAEAEGIEAEALYQLASAVPELVSDLLGLSVTRFAGGVVLSMREDASDRWSRAVGLGFAEPITFDLIGDVIDIWEANRGTSGTLGLAPSVLPGNWDLIASAHGLRPRDVRVRHVGRIDDLDLGTSGVRAGAIEPGEVEEWSRIMAAGQPPAMRDLYTAAVFNPAFLSFAAWDGQEMVAAAGLVVRDRQALLNCGPSAPGHEGAAVREALTRVQVEAAAMAGCDWVSAGTGPSGAAFEAMRRAGLRAAYRRSDWAWVG